MDISYVTDIGERDSQQDNFLAAPDRLVVCDGHGPDGHVFSSFLVREAATFPNSAEGIEEKFREYNDPDQNFLPRILTGGTTFAGVFKRDDGFLICQLGDSYIWYRRDGIVYEILNHSLSHEYCPDIPKLEDMGAEIIKSANGSYYVGKNGRYLAMSRRFGDPHFGELLSPEPDFYLVQADAIVVTSDGFTGGKKIIEKVLAERGKAAKLLEWQQPQLYDNFTAIIAYVN